VIDALGSDAPCRSAVGVEGEERCGQRAWASRRAHRRIIGGELSEGCVPLARSMQDRHEERAIGERARHEHPQWVAASGVVGFVSEDRVELRAAQQRRRPG
jgi:hypothetical protein